MKILDVNAEIEKKIRQALQRELTKRIDRKIDIINAEIREMVYILVYECPEMRSLRSGQLKYDFGLNYDPSESICSAISSASYVRKFRIKIDDRGITGGLFVEIQPTDFINLLSLEDASFVSEKGRLIPWLNWLLTVGSSVIIHGFSVGYADAGRSGGAVMNDGGTFMVDPDYAGTVEDNFITRALSNSFTKLERIVWQNIQN